MEVQNFQSDFKNRDVGFPDIEVRLGRILDLMNIACIASDARQLDIPSIARAIDELFYDPILLCTAIRALAAPALEVAVCGDIENRIVFFLSADNLFALSINVPLKIALHRRNDLSGSLQLVSDPFVGWWQSGGRSLYNEITNPHTLLVALYHPEIFPLPRFSLAISDIARAIRSEFLGTVHLRDMQLDSTIETIVKDLIELRPDILGISATFGQYDVLQTLMRSLESIQNYHPVVVFGGSLSVRIQEVLLKAYPNAFVATGDGERTLKAMVKSIRRGRPDPTTIPGLAWQSSRAGEISRTPNGGSISVEDMTPELDLLPLTLASGGVMQMESSRGCSYACSFCPRDHKGIWKGDDPRSITDVLPFVDQCFRPYTGARRIFLVDEEFIGYRPDDEALPRVRRIAQTLRNSNFTFETSSRLDQVVRRNRDQQWHERRFTFWRELVDVGLDRCLFGIESGIDSILDRFNKKTTKDQVVKGIRALSALGVPYRLTYITFDQLMTMEELVETFTFLSRTDLVLNPLPTKSAREIWEIINNKTDVARYQAGRPVYAEISYMLVTMEALVGAPYTALLGQQGLLGRENPLMGRREAFFQDKRIGVISRSSQVWVDRNFSLDYLLKSTEKKTTGEGRYLVRGLRKILKNYAHSLLGYFISSASGSKTIDRTLQGGFQEADPAIIPPSASICFDHLNAIFRQKMDTHFQALVMEVAQEFELMRGRLLPDDAARLGQHIALWAKRSDWSSINDIDRLSPDAA